jgi:PAS domain S-box-containing protein
MERTADFAGKKIGTVAGTVAYYNAVAHQGWGAELVTYGSWQAALDATHNREVDATLLLSSLSTRLVNLHKLKSDFVDDVVHQYRFAVREGETETLARINDALATVRHNGSFDRIYAKWIGPIEPHPIRLADLRPYAVPAVAVVLAVTGLLWWQRRMLARVARHAEALRRSEERWKFALEGSGDGVWDWNAQTNQVLRSKRWKEMLGYTEEEIGAGLHEWTSRIHPDDLPGVLAAQEAHHAGRTPSLAVEHRLRCKDGSWKWVLNRGMVVQRDEAGRPLRVIGTHTDLTGRKQAEDAAKKLAKAVEKLVAATAEAAKWKGVLDQVMAGLVKPAETPSEKVHNATDPVVQVLPQPIGAYASIAFGLIGWVLTLIQRQRTAAAKAESKANLAMAENAVWSVEKAREDPEFNAAFVKIIPVLDQRQSDATKALVQRLTD